MQNRRRGHYATGARWFDGAQNTIEDPSRLTRVGHVEAADTIDFDAYLERYFS